MIKDDYIKNMKSKIIKRCSDCGRFLSEDDFGWVNKKKGRRQYYCKRCHRNRTYLWRLDNPDYGKQWELNNKEHRRQYIKQYYQDNKENKKQYIKQYYQDNKDKIYAKNARRRVMKKNQTVELTEIEKKRVYYLYKFSSILGKYFQVDHIHPLSKGGLHHPDNLQILEATLNLEKNNKYPLTEEEEIKYKGYTL